MRTTSYWNLVASIGQQALLIFLLLGAALGVITGLLLIFDSARAHRIGAILNRWVSTRAAMRPLEVHHSIKKPLYRMHRLVGGLICAGAIYSLIVLGSPYGAATVAASLSGFGPPRFASWVAQSLTLFLLVGNFGALIFGMFFLARPSSLKGLEAWADRQISGRRRSKPLEQQRFPLDEFARARPRLVGSLILIGSLFVLASAGYPLIR